MNKLKLPFLLALQSVYGLGPVRIKKMLDVYVDPEIVWKLPDSELRTLGLPKPVAETFISTRHTLDPDQYHQSIIDSNISITTLFDDDYPHLLKQIYDPPIILFYLGDLSFATSRTIAIVGSRKMTGYGKLVTTRIAEDLIQADFTIISGLARGIDTVAHQTAVNNHSPTIAVLGGGLNNIFPPENQQLAQEILKKGAIVSEFPPDAPHLPANFPSRNRIIAGLSQGTVVTEADIDSGSLITAQITLDDNRPVFAVPGPITSQMSKGCHLLIKNGATLTTSVNDIFDQLSINATSDRHRPDPSNLSDFEKQILSLLETEIQIDDLARTLKLPASKISASLVKLELTGFVSNLGNGNFIKN